MARTSVLLALAMGVFTACTPSRSGPDSGTPDGGDLVDGGVVESACQVTGVHVLQDLHPTLSPDGRLALLNVQSDAGLFEIYVDPAGTLPHTCISCTARPGGPLDGRHKYLASWAPSSQWILTGGEQDFAEGLFLGDYGRKLLIESGIFMNIYAVRPDGSEWHRLTSFDPDKGFSGVPFAGDGSAIWAQSIPGDPGVTYPFGHWALKRAAFVEDNQVDGGPSFQNIQDITPAGANWVEPGNVAPDGRTLLITADIGLSDARGQDQFLLELQTGAVTNLTRSPDVWDEHGLFSPDGKKVIFMSSYPFRADPDSTHIDDFKSEFMLMNRDGSGLQLLTHFNIPGYPETLPSFVTAANAVFSPDGTQAFGTLLTNTASYTPIRIDFAGPCGNQP